MGTPPGMTPGWSRLGEALADTTVAISTASLRGTGFFVAPRLVLTCAHVLGDVRESAALGGPPAVTGTWRNRPLVLQVVPGWVLPADGGGPDLALLRVSGEAAAHPVACLAGAAEPGDELWAYGYPDGAYRAGDSLTFSFEGPSQRADGTGLYRAAHGRAVPGFSGSPALNWRTGMVCGIIRLADHPPGGPPLIRLTPITVAMETYSGVLPGGRSASRQWLDLLDDDQLRAAGSGHPGPRLRGYLAAARHCDEERHADADTPGTPGLMEVYQVPQLTGLGDASASVDDAGIGTRDLLVVGDPGAGKSSLLHWVRHQAAVRLLAGEETGYVPVLVQARILAEQHPASFPEAMAAAVGEELGLWMDDPLPAAAFMREPIPGTPWLLLVDGFEEILTSEFRQRALSVLAFWSGRAHLRLLITSRPLAEQEFKPLAEKGITRTFLAPFDLERVRGLAVAWLARLSGEDGAARRAGQLIDAIERGQVKALARIPLVTTMLCRLRVSGDREELPQSRYLIYERFVNTLLYRQLAELDALPRLRDIAQRYPGGQQAAERVLEALSTLLTAFAVERAGARQPAGGLSAFASARTENLRPRAFPADRWAVLIVELLRQSGLVIGDDFSHQTIADFLVARESMHNPQACDVTPEQAAELWYLLRHRSLVSFLAAGWAQHHPGRLRSLCEILAERTVNHQEFLATFLDDGVQVPPDIVQRLAKTLATEANNPVRGPGGRVISAALLARLDQRQALPRLRILALDPRTDDSFTTFLLNSQLRDADAAEILMRADRAGAPAVLLAQADDPGRPAGRRLKAARRLAELDRDLGAAALTRVIQARSAAEEVRLDGIRTLAAVNRAKALEVAESLAQDASLAVPVTLVISEFAPSEAAGGLARLAGNPALALHDRAAAASRWALLQPEDHQPGTILASLATDPSASPADRLHAVAALSEADPARALPLLQGLLAEDADDDISVRVRAAELLARRYPGSAAPVLATLGNLSAVTPALATDLFTAWTAITPSDSVPALASYIQTIASAPFHMDELSQRQEYFPRLFGLLRDADQARALAELHTLIHEPDFGILRDEAERLWAEIEPERCADHLAAIACGDHQTPAGMEDVWEVRRAGALLALAQMGDSRALAIADHILQAAPAGDRFPSHHVRYAAMAVAELDRDRGAGLLAEFALNARLDPMARMEFGQQIWWISESRYAAVCSALARDKDIRPMIFYLGPIFGEAREILTGFIRDPGIEQAERESIIEWLLAEDPARAIKILIELTRSDQQNESRWARQRLARALDALEITRSSPGTDDPDRGD